LTGHPDTSFDTPPAPVSLSEAGDSDEARPTAASDIGEQTAGATARALRRRELAEDKPTPREKWGRVTVELPQDVIDQLKERALRNRCSVRHLVMKALRTANIRIREADMSEDARKGNGRKSGG
jgi:hypothetical protein